MLGFVPAQYLRIQLFGRVPVLEWSRVRFGNRKMLMLGWLDGSGLWVEDMSR